MEAYIIKYIPYYLPGTLYLRFTKSGKVQSTRNSERATRFASEEEARQNIDKAPGLSATIIKLGE